MQIYVTRFFFLISTVVGVFFSSIAWLCCYFNSLNLWSVFQLI